MWKTIKLGTAAVALAFVILMVGVVGYAVGDTGASSSGTSRQAEQSSQSQGYSILDEIQGILKEDFVAPDAVNPDTLQKGAINGLIQSLGDPHTVYISPEDFSVGIDIISGAFQGIGAQVDQDRTTRERLTVAPFRDSPAVEAGILPGDVLLSVNGESAQGWTVADAVKKIRGPEGTQVTLSVRDTDKTEEQLTIDGATIQTPTLLPAKVRGLAVTT